MWKIYSDELGYVGEVIGLDTAEDAVAQAWLDELLA